jgi:hypothetical protein
VSVLSIRDFGPLLVGVECTSRMRPGTHLNVIVRRGARHRRYVVITVWVIDRLRVGRVVRRVPNRVAISLRVTGVRVDFVASKDNRAFNKNEELSERLRMIRTDHME